jgi:hypothetical protein
VFECPALQEMHDRYETLFQASQGDAMILFMWQVDIIGVARFIGACLDSKAQSTHQLALPWGPRHLMSPELAGKDVMILLLLLPQVGITLLKLKPRLDVGITCLSVLERQCICTQGRSHSGPCRPGLLSTSLVMFCHSVSVHIYTSCTAHQPSLWLRGQLA